jgi:hypothetical protein
MQRKGAYSQVIHTKIWEENQMNLKKEFPYVVAIYLIAVGLFFILSDTLGASYFSAEPPGKYYLFAISFVFIAAGVVACYLKYQGRMKIAGKSVREVRLEAIENFKDKALLANIALEENDPEIQKAAEERLKAVSGEEIL